MRHWRLVVIPLTILCSILLLWLPLKDDKIRLEHAAMATLTITSSGSEGPESDDVSEEAENTGSPTKTPPASKQDDVSPVALEAKPLLPTTALPSLPTMAMLAERLPVIPRMQEEPEPVAIEEASPVLEPMETGEEPIIQEPEVPEVMEPAPSVSEETAPAVEDNPVTVSEEEASSVEAESVPVKSSGISSADASSGTDEVMIGGYHVLDGNTVPPVYRNVKLSYPSMAKRRNIEGSAEIEVYVSERGKIDKVVLVHASREEFGEAALKAFKKAKAEPATKDGKAIAVVQRIPVRFSLK